MQRSVCVGFIKQDTNNREKGRGREGEEEDKTNDIETGEFDRFGRPDRILWRRNEPVKVAFKVTRPAGEGFDGHARKVGLEWRSKEEEVEDNEKHSDHKTSKKDGVDTHCEDGPLL